jgi:hypothetical protein
MLARNATSPDVLGCPAMAVVSWHDDNTAERHGIIRVQRYVD